MKRTSLLGVLLASSVLVPLNGEASLLVGFHNFTGDNASEPADVGVGFSGTVTKSGVPSENTGGSNDNRYGNSDIAVLGGVSPNTQDGHVKVQDNKDVTFSFKNTSGGSVPLTSLLFDAAYRDSTSTVLNISYKIGTGSVVQIFSSTVGSMAPPMMQVTGANFDDPANYSDYVLSLIGLTVANNETISFIFSLDPGAGATSSETIRLDNVLLTAVPEPGSLIALGALIGSGCFLRSRRRPVVAGAV